MLDAGRLRPALSNDEDRPDSLAEYDSAETINAVARALARRFRVSLVEADENAYAKLKKLRPGLVFNISEGFRGPNREAHVPVICEILGLSYTGSDALTMSVCLDKARAKETLAFHGIPTPDFMVCEDGKSCKRAAAMRFPVIVKPLREGSSMGIQNDSVVFRRGQLKKRVAGIIRKYQQPALVEEFLPGREFTVGVVGNAPAYKVLPLVEINHRALPPGSNPVYGYEAKWLWDTPASPLDLLICPARVTERLRIRIKDMVLRALTVLRVRDWCRVDLRLSATGQPQILELNPLPGILPDPRDNSALPAAARAAGWSYDELILRVARAAIERWNIR